MAKHLTNLGSDGTTIGQTVSDTVTVRGVVTVGSTTSDKLGFFGTTAVVKYATTLSAGQMASSAATITTVQAIITALAYYGLYTIGG